MKDLRNRMKRLSLNNQMWIESYTGIKQSGQNNIKSDLVTMMETLGGMNHRDIDTIEYSNLETYIRMLKVENAPNTFNRKVGTIRNFFDYISKEYDRKINFNTDNLKTFTVRKKDILQEDKASKPLRVSEIAKLRMMLQDDDIKSFSFDLAYLYGCTLDELEQSSNCYDYETRTFRFKERKIEVSESIHQTIIRNDKVLKSRKASAYSDYFRSIGERAQVMGLLDRGLMWSDIKATRDENFIKCAECRRVINENSSDNWVLIRYSFDPLETKWIVCRSCGTGGGQYR